MRGREEDMRRKGGGTLKREQKGVGGLEGEETESKLGNKKWKNHSKATKQLKPSAGLQLACDRYDLPPH